jgi:hypothetical protein
MKWKTLNEGHPHQAHSIAVILKDDKEKKIHFGWITNDENLVIEFLLNNSMAAQKRLNYEHILCWMNLNDPPSSDPTVQKLLRHYKRNIDFPILDIWDEFTIKGIRI